MGKLMKYEFRKQLASKVVVGILAAITELVFLIGVFCDKEEWAGFGMAIMIILTVIALSFFSFEAIITYSNDLKTKQSYMLFLTPRNMFQIVGAKMLTTVLQILGVGAAFAAIIFGDVFLIFARNNEVKAFFDGLKEFFKVVGFNVELSDLIYIITIFLVSWLEFVLMAMFAITLSTTFFANNRFKGVISFTIYFVLNFLLGRFANYVTNGFGESESLMSSTDAWLYVGIYAVAMVLCFLGTSWLLEKKVSV